MSVLTADVLEAFEAQPLATRVYFRQCYVPAPPAPPDPLWINAAAPSRWQTPAGTLYVAEGVDTVMAEYCRNDAAAVSAADPTGGAGLTLNNFNYFAAQAVGDPVPVRALFSVDVELDCVVDFLSDAAQARLAAIGIEPVELLADDYGPCPQLAQLGEQLGWQAIRARSAADVDGVAIAIVHGSHPAAHLWHTEADAVRPSVRIAYLTRYKAGERPAWLAN